MSAEVERKGQAARMTPSRTSLIFALVLGSGILSSPSRAESPPVGGAVVAFQHATVIPMDVERVLRDHTVVVANGRIVALGPASAVEVPPQALRVDARGRYLIPALCDMHVHLLGESWNMMLPPEERLVSEDIPYEGFLLPFVANGVTTVQDLAAAPEAVLLRDRIASGELLGPRMILARMIDGPEKAWPPPLSIWVSTAAEAATAVRQARAQGYDKIKVYSFLTKESYDAIVVEARKLGMDVIGHVPMSLSVEYVVDAGQKLIAHTEEMAKHAHGDYSAGKIDHFATLLAGRGVWVIPTLMTTRSILEFFVSRDSLLARPEMSYFSHPMQQGVWSFLMTRLYEPTPAEARKRIRDDFERLQRPLTKALNERGGKLLAGSDALMIGDVPGFALHRELRELVEVGLTPFQALRTSTTNPFEYLGEADQAGTIAVGQRTDLLLLDGNPLEDISAASRIAGVLMRGRWIGSVEIRERMRSLTASFATSR